MRPAAFSQGSALFGQLLPIESIAEVFLASYMQVDASCIRSNRLALSSGHFLGPLVDYRALQAEIRTPTVHTFTALHRTKKEHQERERGRQ